MKKRPVIISIAVVLGMIGAIFVLIGSIIVMAISPFIGIITLLIAFFQIAVLAGLWKMKRWALITYTVLFILGLFGGNTQWYNIILPILVIVFGFISYKEMD